MEENILESAKQGLYLDPSKYRYRLKQPEDVIKNQIKSQEFAQIHSRKKISKYQRIPITAPPNSYQADLSFYDSLSHYNHGYKIILNIIEITSRFVYSYPLKSKADTTEAFTDLLEKKKVKVRSITTDKGREFLNSKVKALFKKYEIFNYDTLSKTQVGLVERFNGTQRALIERLLTIEKGSKKEHNWVDSLDDITKNYNTAPHNHLNISGKEYSPKQIYDDPKLANIIHQRDLRRSYDLQDELLDNFKVGDTVRVARSKNRFEKGAIANFSTATYKIKEIKLPGTIVVSNESKTKEVPYTSVLKVVPSVYKLRTNDNLVDKAPSRKQLKKQKQIAQSEAREGISKENILETKRVSKPKQQFQFKD